MNAASTHAAILFEPDGYRLDGQKLMGRQAAGSGFLRAAVAASRGQPLFGYTANKASAQSFEQTVKEIDPGAQTGWIHPSRPDRLARVGHLYIPGPTLGDLSRQRLRSGAAAWSLTGVTHTTASHGAMDSIAELLTAPLMPWDALICTSQAVLSTVQIVLDAQRDFLQWRSKATWNAPLPQLPVIPLGVHCKDFEIAPAARASARKAMNIADDHVVVLFVGRLSFHAKAHPHAMYLALQETARASGKKIVLVQCGWFANKPIEDAFRTGADATCPDVRCIYTDGRDAKARTASWAAADIFISLSDNVQETFGLTPIEAMAAGLPLVVTDWDGYKDTVRDGVDGFRIPTWTPPPGTGEFLARGHEQQIHTYDMYCGLNSMHVALDHRILAQRLTSLAMDAQLRHRLGAAGQERARQFYDWAHIYRAYQALWQELGSIRTAQASLAQGAPTQAPARLDPFVAFAHYPTALVESDTRLHLRAGATTAAFDALAQHPLFSFMRSVMPTSERVEQLLGFLRSGDSKVAAVSAALAIPEAEVQRAAAVLGKLALIDLDNG